MRGTILNKVCVMKGVEKIMESNACYNDAAENDININQHHHH